MLWNVGLHITAGFFSSKIFTWTSEGIIWCGIITGIVQGVDMFRIYHTTIKRIRQQPLHIQDEQMRTFKKRMPATFSQLFLAKFIGYGLVTLVTASIIRTL
jgi:hypothetical protein